MKDERRWQTADRAQTNDMAVYSVDRRHVLAFRLHSHNLATKLTPASTLVAAGACGLQNTPPGSAALALNARIANLDPQNLENALVKSKTLLQAWSLRASPRIFPTADAAFFTLGLLPIDEQSTRSFIYAVEPALEKIGIRATDAVELAADGLLETLNRRSLTKDDLGVELARWVAPRLLPSQRTTWKSASWYAPGQTLGESVIRFALPLVALRGLCCHADRRGNKAYLMRTDQWLGTSFRHTDLGAARAELVRRYLHCYGPSTADHFALWAGIDQAQAARAWALVEPELIGIDFEGKRTWLLRRDLGGLMSPPMPKGFRFLPPHDPFLELRDRETFVSEPKLRAHLWRNVGNPGVVLVDGQFVATWRAEKKSNRLRVMVEPFGSLPASVRHALQAEAATLAPFKGCSAIETAFMRVSCTGRRMRNADERPTTKDESH